MRNNPYRWSEVSTLLGDLYSIVARLKALFPGRKFTPDGHLVGSIGEAMAAYMFDLHLLSAAEPRHDATTANGQTRVQIKLTQGKRRVALGSKPEHLLVLQLATDLSVKVVYNGLGQGPWSAAGRMQKNGQRPISLSKLSAIDRNVPDSKRLPVRNKLDLRR